MEHNDKLISEIEAYLSNKMQESDSVLFEKRIKNEPSLRLAVQEMKDLKKGIELAGEKKIKEQLKTIENKLQTENFFTNSKKTIKMTNKKNNFRWASIAASFALMLVAGYFILSPETSTDPKEAFAQYYKPDNSVINDVLDRMEARGLAKEKTMSDDSLVTALKAYKTYDYQSARKGLSEYLDNYPEDQTARFYMGLTQLQLSNYAKATEYLQPLCTEDGFKYKDTAKWYLAMGCSQLEGPDGMKLATKYLKQLAQNNKSEYQANAKAYLTAIEK